MFRFRGAVAAADPFAATRCKHQCGVQIEDKFAMSDRHHQHASRVRSPDSDSRQVGLTNFRLLDDGADIHRPAIGIIRRPE